MAQLGVDARLQSPLVPQGVAHGRVHACGLTPHLGEADQLLLLRAEQLCLCVRARLHRSKHARPKRSCARGTLFLASRVDVRAAYAKQDHARSCC